MLFPGFEVIDQLHQGDNSSVYRAERLADSHPVILKAFEPAYPAPGRIAEIEAEFRLQSQLDAEVVPKALALETHEGRWLLVMHDDGAQSIARDIGETPMTTRERLDLSLAIVDALDELHSQEIIHKDINPANILWKRETSKIYIADYDAATVLRREEPVLCSPTLLEGTLTYIAPEQTGRINASLDYRADYYSLGATLYEIFVQAPPFATEDPVELVHCHIAKTPESPAERLPSVPVSVSDIIMKLLAKSADDRYQSAVGLRRDLERCIAQINGSEPPGRFALGRDDRTVHLRVPNTLYGRKRELDRLHRALDRCVSGSGTRVGGSPVAELFLVAGHSGVGKSALVGELQPAVVASHARFVSGKFEQLQRTVPYAAIVQSLRGLIRELLTLSDTELDDWRLKLRSALGSSGRVLCEVIPEIELVCGPQPPIQALEPHEARNRFNLVFRRFISALAQPAHPLVLFLDDLQWADLASLSFLEELLSDDRPMNLLVIGAFRNDEIGIEHPLRGILSRDVDVELIELAPLEFPDVSALVADTLAVDADRTTGLARQIARITEGNPLFIREFLDSLYVDGLLRFDREAAVWTWDLAKIETAGATDNILSLMTRKIQQMPEPTRKSLYLAACIGSSFELQTLAAVRGRQPIEIVEELLPAIDAGVVVMSSALRVHSDHGDSLRRCRFFHDRVQHSAYETASSDARAHTHLAIGRYLLEQLHEHGQAEQLFDVVDQLNRGRSLVDDASQRLEIATLNLRAGKRASASGAFDAAAEYLRVAESLLPERRWTDHYQLALEVHSELTMAEHYVGDHERAKAWTDLLLVHGRTDLDKARAYRLRVLQDSMLSRHTEALDSAKIAFELLGQPLPSADVEALVGSEYGALSARLGANDPLDRLEQELLSDPAMMELSQLILATLASAIQIDPALYSLLVIRRVALATEHGHPPGGYSMYASYAHLLAGPFGQPQLADRFGRLGLELAERHSNLRETCIASLMVANFVRFWVAPMSESRAINQLGFRAGVESGTLLQAGYILTYGYFYDILVGRLLPEVETSGIECLAFVQRTNNTLAEDSIRMDAVALANLLGHTAGPESFDVDGGAKEQQMLAACWANKSVQVVPGYYILKTYIHVLYRHAHLALAMAEQTEPMLPLIPATYAITQHVFRTALALAVAADTDDEPTRAERLTALDARVAQLKGWADRCRENFGHMYELANAEAARLRGDLLAAVDGYERALALAEAGDYLNDVALINEWSARMWFQRGNDVIGRRFLIDAFHHYRRWGCRPKLALLEAEFPWLSSTIGQPLQRGSGRSHRTGTSLDIASVLKASQTISGELSSGRLLECLMQIVVENAGAERGVLILAVDGELRVEAVAEPSAEPNAPGLAVEIECGIPLRSYHGLAHKVVNLAMRTADSVIVDDALMHAEFSKDPYVLERCPRSVLAAPVTSKGEPLGYLYLENGLAAGVFTAARLELLRMLSAQFVISLENARLYDDLERRVSLRTEELAGKNEELGRALENLEIAQARLIHAEKMNSLGQLSAGVAHEISNPLNFITNFADLSFELLDDVDLDGEPTDLREDVGDLVEDLRTNLGMIRKHGDRVTKVVRGMLQHVKKTDDARERVGLNQLIAGCVELSRIGSEFDHDIELELDDSVGPVELNPREFTEVMTKLLTNAHEAVTRRAASAPGHRGVLTISSRRDGSSVEIRVRDNGDGIPLAIRGRIFDPFFTTKSGTEGTGLSLWLCYDVIVQGHRGSLDVESVVGQGSTFIIRLGMGASSSPRASTLPE